MLHRRKFSVRTKRKPRKAGCPPPQNLIRKLNKRAGKVPGNRALVNHQFQQAVSDGSYKHARIGKSTGEDFVMIHHDLPEAWQIKDMLNNLTGSRVVAELRWGAKRPWNALNFHRRQDIHPAVRAVYLSLNPALQCIADMRCHLSHCIENRGGVSGRQWRLVKTGLWSTLRMLKDNVSNMLCGEILHKYLKWNIDKISRQRRQIALYKANLKFVSKMQYLTETCGF